jgi:hypothetical protein
VRPSARGDGGLELSAGLPPRGAVYPARFCSGRFESIVPQRRCGCRLLAEPQPALLPGNNELPREGEEALGVLRPKAIPHRHRSDPSAAPLLGESKSLFCSHWRTQFRQRSLRVGRF